jgi:hypothetical protein
MPEIIRRAEETKEPGLSTADLANLREPRMTEQEISRDNEQDWADSEQRDSQTADVTTIDRRSSTEPADTSENGPAPLFSTEESNGLHARWNAIQVSFVDEPREAVQQADGLVASTMKRLAEIFAEERGKLDQEWDRGGDVSTEELRVALRRYRSFFGRLLSV